MSTAIEPRENVSSCENSSEVGFTEDEIASWSRLPRCLGLRLLPNPNGCRWIPRSNSRVSTRQRVERHLLPPSYTMRPGVVVLSLSLYVLAALAALHQPTSAHISSRLHQLSLPLFDHLSWLLPDTTLDDLYPPVYATGSTKPVVAQ